MIGVLDSGVGGLAIYREIKKRFPDKAVAYFADKANFPYGEKTDAELLVIVRAAVQTLLKYGANVIVLACNSATVATVGAIRTEFEVPIIGIEPAVKQAARETKTCKIGVLATKRTVEDHKGEELAPGCEIIRSHNATLVSKIENDYDAITDQELMEAMQPFMAANVDTVVLGCTHYHFVKDRLVKLFPDLRFFAPDEAIVSRLETVVLEKNIELASGNDIFLCSADVAGFTKSLFTLLGIKDADIRKI